LVCGTYSYPDDQPILDSAAMLSRDLAEIASLQPNRRVTLVSHSMGGLLARAMLEDPEFDSGNVTKLIMIAPPNQGSLLARVGYGTDLLDHAVADVDREEVSRFYAAIADGMSEATVDLQPDSVFLRELNARPRNPRVKYAILLGNGARFTREQIDKLREGLATAESKSRVVALFARRVDETLADLDEVVRGTGDGAVALKRGRLEGVDDVVVLDFSHLSVLQGARITAEPAFQEVLKRLRAE
jgi:pimeloyl-ACP methyl ester carboxylesterase